MVAKEHTIDQREYQSRVLITNLVFLILWVLIFTIAYAQSPLYTSNQNQYFLHGLAQAKWGFLGEDWLANTLDPTPAFSKLIEITWKTIPWEPIFYLYFGVLVGVYLFSILGIADQLWGFSTTRSKRWLYLSSLVILHSAALRYLISRVLGVSWDYLLDGGVAGQRLLGTVLQPSTFGVLLVLSIYLLLRRSYVWAIICLLAATSFHPTYLLSAGVLTAVYMGILFWESKDLRASLAFGMGALLGVIPTLYHVYATFGNTNPELTAQAREILINFRIPHHAVVAEWLDASVLVKLGFVGLTLIILQSCRKKAFSPSDATVASATKLFHIILWPALIAILLTIIQVITGNVTLALLFPWRLSTWLIPLSISLAAGWGVHLLYNRLQLERFSSWVLAVSLITALIFAVMGMVKFQISWQEKNSAPDRPMMAFVEANKQSNEVYLTPIKMQDFRLETGAPVYVDFKSIPYKDVEVLEWYRRVQLAEDFYTHSGCGTLAYLAAEGVTHLVAPNDLQAIECFGMESVFFDENFGVFTIQKP